MNRTEIIIIKAWPNIVGFGREDKVGNQYQIKNVVDAS